MPGPFDQQTVLITGASSGFGQATAHLFAQQGARLILLARRQERLEALKQALVNQYQTECLLIQADVQQLDDISQKLADLPAPFSIPDILINNAGLAKGLAKVWEISPTDWNEMIDTNLKGVLHVTRAILPKMLKANRGHVINIGSISAYSVYPGGGVYCATKFGLRALTDTLRMELVDTPIRVSLISPGMARTEFSRVRFEGKDEQAEQVYKGMQPLNPEDIAEAILFIASRPKHVNIADIIIYPKDQASTNLIHRKS